MELQQESVYIREIPEALVNNIFPLSFTLSKILKHSNFGPLMNLTL